jgi:putative membrane protein
VQVTDITIRPTAKFLKAGALLAAILFIALEVLYLMYEKDKLPQWVMIGPPLIMLWPLSRWIRRQSTNVTIIGDRLRYESGMAAKTTRTIQLTKIQDVRVEQGMLQRVFGVGNISIETAGEASRLTIVHVDHPQPLADELLDRAQHHNAVTGTGTAPGIAPRVPPQ